MEEKEVTDKGRDIKKLDEGPEEINTKNKVEEKFDWKLYPIFANGHYYVKRRKLNQPTEKKQFKLEPEHPLLNRVVLDNIFSYFDSTPTAFKHLKSFRLVCKTWYDEVTPRWRSTAAIKLIESEDAPVEGHGGVPGLPLNKFLYYLSKNKYTLKTSVSSYSRYIFSGFTLGSDDENELWSVIGPAVKYLHVAHCTFPFNQGDTDAIRCFPFTNLCNIKTLILTNGKFKLPEILEAPTGDEISPESPPPNDWEVPSLTWVEVRGEFPLLPLPEMVRRFPNLVTTLIPFRGSVDNYTYRFFDFNVPRSGNDAEDMVKALLPKLNRIHGIYTDNYPISTTILRLGLKESYFPLEDITSISSQTSCARRLLKLLNVYLADSVLFSCFIFPHYSSPPPWYMSALRYVKSYSIKKIELWGSCVKSLAFLITLPNLESIYMSYSCYELRSMFKKLLKEGECIRKKRLLHHIVSATIEEAPQIRNTVMPNLTSFHIDYFFHSRNMHWIYKWMPNLNRLECVLDNNALHEVCRYWPHLTDLYILYGSTVNDDGIVGGERHTKSVRDLRNLRSFRLDAYCNEGRLTDESVFRGFVRMPKLEKLQICVSKTMNSDAEAALVMKIRDVKVIRNYGNKPHEGLDCCERVRYNETMNPYYTEFRKF